MAGDAAGEAVEAGATFLTRGTHVARATAAHTTHSTLLIQSPPRVTGTSMTVGVPMVSWKAAVTVRTLKARSALTTASLITAFRQGPCWAAAAQLTEREVEIAKGTVVTPVPLKAGAAHALARLWVTEAVGYPRARALARVAARAVESGSTELTVDAQEVGFADTASQLRVLPAGITLGSCGIAVTVHDLSGGKHLFSRVIVRKRRQRVAAWEVRVALSAGGTQLSGEVRPAVTAARQVFAGPIREV